MQQIFIQKVLRGQELVDYKKDLTLTNIQHEIIVGTLLGDSSMQAMKGNQLSNLKFEQQLKNKDYIDHLYTELQDLVGTKYFRLD